MNRLVLCMITPLMLLPAFAAVAWGQTLPSPQAPVASENDVPLPIDEERRRAPRVEEGNQPADPSRYGSAADTNPADAAEQAKIWNSPAMLRARAWLQEYCARSAKVTPEDAQRYMAELEHMSPTQMKLWLLKFEEQEEMMQQQQAAFNMQRQAGMQQALGYHQSVQRAYSNINLDETAKAETAENQLQQQQQFSEEAGLQKSADRDIAATTSSLPWGMAWANQSPWGPYAGYPMGGPGPYGQLGGGYQGYGHYHVHYHVNPVTGGATQP